MRHATYLCNRLHPPPCCNRHPAMTHYLAESICELAVPPLQPSFIRLVAHGDYPSLVVLLHVRPRQLTAGIEVAAYSGVAESDEVIAARIGRQGIIYAVQQTQAGLEQFVADLLATSPEEWDDGLNDCKLALPLHGSAGVGSGWDSMYLHLLPPSTVQIRTRQGPAPPSQDWLPIRMPTIFSPGEAMAAVEVTNGGASYAHSQSVLKRQLAQQKREQAAAAAGGPPAPSAADSATAATAAAAPAAPPQPDSDAEFQQKYRALRDEAMADLKAALLAMLRQALRYRGTCEFPGAPPPAVPDEGAGPA